jgi:hypothetical protein
LQRALQRKAKGKTRGTQRGDDRGGLNAKLPKHRHEDQNEQSAVEKVLEEARQRLIDSMDSRDHAKGRTADHA